MRVTPTGSSWWLARLSGDVRLPVLPRRHDSGNQAHAGHSAVSAWRFVAIWPSSSR